MNTAELLRYIHRDNFLPNGELKRRYPDLDNIPADQANLIRVCEHPVKFDVAGPVLSSLADALNMKKAPNALACVQTCVRLGLIEIFIHGGKQYIQATDAGLDAVEVVDYDAD